MALIILTVLLPISIISLADNGIYRISDTYRYNFNDTEIVSQERLSVDVYEVAHAFSGYLMGAQDEFHLTEEIGNNKEDLFSKEASQTMENVKTLLDVMLIVGIAGLLLSVVSYCMMLRRRMKDELRQWAKRALIVFIGLLVVNALIQAVPVLRDLVLGWAYDFNFDKEELFVVIMKGTLLQQFAIFDSVLAAIIMAVCGYVHNMITKPRKLFFKR